jgi:hypothetical protein
MTGVCVTVTVTVGATVTVGVTVTEGVTVVLGVTVMVGVTVTEGVTVAGTDVAGTDVAGTELPPLDAGADPLGEGRNVVGDAAGGDDDVQPETAAEPRTATVPQPTAVSSTRSAVPVIGVRTLFRYPAGQS